MYVVLCLFIVVDFVVLTVWQVIDPPYRELESFPHERPDDVEMDVEIKPQLEHCSSRYLNVWLGKYQIDLQYSQRNSVVTRNKSFLYPQNYVRVSGWLYLYPGKIICA